MASLFTRPLLVRPLAAALLLSLGACAGTANAEAPIAGPVIGVDLGGAAATNNIAAAGYGHAPQPAARPTVMAHSGHAQAQGSGTVNGINAPARTITISHGPIAALGWPAMTMDFAVAPGVNLQGLAPGTRINFTIEHADQDRYIIQSIKPAAGGR